MTKFVAPAFGLPAFNCPFCDVCAHMEWRELRGVVEDDKRRMQLTDTTPAPSLRVLLDSRMPPKNHVWSAGCHACNKQSIWISAMSPPDGMTSSKQVQDYTKRIQASREIRKNSDLYYGEMVFPYKSSAPPAHDDLPDSCKEFYREAGDIHDKSPRAAAAMLRLCTEKLIEELGDKSGKSLNAKIAQLQKDGLRQDIVDALDALRVIANDAVHLNREIALVDDRNTALALFETINHIVEERITAKSRISRILDLLPDSQKAAIRKRDDKTQQPGASAE